MQQEFTFPEDTPAIPFGYCHCGCGQKTRIAKKTCTEDGVRKGLPLRFLKGHYARLSPPIPRNTPEAFWRRVNIGKPEECWNFDRPYHDPPNNYGRLQFNGKSRGSHCVAYELTCGPIPQDMEVCHTCDNPLCCNPKHLFAASHSDNLRDMHAKGRRSMFGENSPKHRFSNHDIIEIRTLRYICKWKVREIANCFDASIGTIEGIISGKSWPHI